MERHLTFMMIKIKKETKLLMKVKIYNLIYDNLKFIIKIFIKFKFYNFRI